MLISLLPFILIFVIMYFLILRPQQKRVKQHQEMVKNVRRGDTVVTSGGLVGKVTKVVDDDQIEVEIADGVRVRQMRQMIADVRAKGEPVKDERLSWPRSGGRRRLNGQAPCFIFRAGRLTAILLTTLLVCLFAVPNFFPQETVQELADMGAAPHRARASTCRAARTSCSRSTPTRCARRRSKRCATTCAAWCARTGSAVRRRLAIRGNTVEVPHPRRRRPAARADEAPRIVAAARRPAERHRPAHGRRRRCRRRPVPADRRPSRRSSSASARSVEQSIQIIERRVNELGTVEPLDPAAGRRPHPGAGAGRLQDPQRLKELLGKTAKLTFRMVDQIDAAGAGAAGRAAAEIRNPARHQGRRTASPI